MRKLISPCLFVLFLFAMSSQLLADADVCEEMKAELQAVDAYGLCIAWHNANGDAKERIADKFLDRTGIEITDLGNPASSQDFYCPCWDELSFCDVEALGTPRITVDGETGAVVAVSFLDLVFFNIEGFGSDGEFCFHVIQELGQDPWFYDDNDGNSLVGYEPSDCQDELVDMATMDLAGECS